ncbi:MAG: hypothetical protein KGL18_11930 [Burkholderiales bacterium]|nr:hypothetical protein [Burkholderiales bacterium]MDE1925719.1 hypothetical protein [Burkholderiales bacterium]MDE2157650.1 hypothetical protein [Burkholderiales bacterium]MDE2503665.1 hypothetical protein [Burkholderiales bacterium]
MDLLSTAQSLGFQLPSPAYIIGSILFGLIGMWAFAIGKRRQQPRLRWSGVALMFYPYVIGGTLMLYVVGAALCGAVWYWWDE